MGKYKILLMLQNLMQQCGKCTALLLVQDASGVFLHLSHTVDLLRMNQCDSVISLEMKCLIGMSLQAARHTHCKISKISPV